MSADLKVAQLLCSRLCHDLLSPAGAVSTGLEFIGEGSTGGQTERAEAMALVTNGARQVTRRLAFYRAAFGAGGDMRMLTDALDLAVEMLAETGVRLAIPARSALPKALTAEGIKLVLALILVGAGALPRGGTLTVDIAALPEGIGVALAAAGTGAGIRDEVRAAMAETVAPAELTPRNVHGYLTRAFAKSLGTDVEWAAEAGVVRLACVLRTA
jgi:histidine phosphotransferase ChpT